MSSSDRWVRASARPPVSDVSPPLWRWPTWMVVSVAVIAAAAVIVFDSGMTPSFDAYGWLTWGHQVLYGNLNLNAAPSWKPLMIIFTLPIALFGHAGPRLLSIAMTAGTVAMAPFAWRIAYRLVIEDRDPAQRTRRLTLAAWIGGLLAAVGVLGLQGHDVPLNIGPPQSLWNLTFIADSDPLAAAIVLAALDAHLSRRPRLAYVLLFLAGLNRPEAWALLFVYGIYLIWRVPGARLLVVGGWVLTLVAWYLPTAIAAKSILQASKLDQGKVSTIKGLPIIPVLRRWVTFYEWPMQAAALVGVAIALLRRDLRALWIVAAVVVWLVAEMLFAAHGFSAVARYMIEPAALMVALAGYGIGRVLAGPGPGLRGAPARVAVSLAGALVAVGLIAGMAFFWHLREARVRLQLDAVRNYGIVAHHLSAAVDRAGGRRAVLACGTPAALNQYQTELAWVMGLNGSQVKFRPPLLLATHQRIVLFTETQNNGWTVRAYNVPRPLAARCDHTMSVSIASAGI